MVLLPPPTDAEQSTYLHLAWLGEEATRVLKHPILVVRDMRVPPKFMGSFRRLHRHLQQTGLAPEIYFQALIRIMQSHETRWVPYTMLLGTRSYNHLVDESLAQLNSQGRSLLPLKRHYAASPLHFTQAMIVQDMQTFVQLKRLYGAMSNEHFWLLLSDHVSGIFLACHLSQAELEQINLLPEQIQQVQAMTAHHDLRDLAQSYYLVARKRYLDTETLHGPSDSAPSLHQWQRPSPSSHIRQSRSQYLSLRSQFST